MPKTVESRMQKAPARSAENPWYFSSLTMSMPTDLMIFSPPTLVPTPMTALHSTMSHTGITAPVRSGWPFEKATPSSRTPMNFWPSWAPCMKLMAAAPKICRAVKVPLAFRRSTAEQSMVSSLHMPQPMAKPSARLRTRP